MAEPFFLAVDLGASSGRVIAASLRDGRFSLRDVHRFPNGPVKIGAHFHTDFDGLWREVRTGLAASGGVPAGIGVDTWGVDYGLLDAAGDLIGPPYHYRDARTAGEMDRVFRTVPRGEVFRATGIQFMQINTLYQLHAAARTGDSQLARAATLLFTPDLFHHRLCGVKVAEYTIASTSQMLDAHDRNWAHGMLAALALPGAILPPVVMPGTILGDVLGPVADGAGWAGAVPVIAVGSHDTASAVAAVPELDAASAYLSSGTWSLMGIETRQPVIHDLALAFNVTNEGGVGGTIRVLKNIMGLWLVQECQRRWEADGRTYDWSGLVAQADGAEPFRSLVDPDAPEFLAPGDMPAAIRGYCRRTGQPEPATPGGIVRCCLESLALKYRLVLGDLERLAGRRLEVIRVVGGGSRNALLNRMTADACGRPVVAGPVEATALGNVVLQAVATGALPDLAAGRRAVAASFERETFTPGPAAPWDEAWQRFQRLISGSPV